METVAAREQTRRNLAARHPALSYFLLTFGLSWAGAFALVAPRLVRGEPIPKFTGLMMFPVMLLGPATAGITMTAWAEGRDGLRALGRRLARYRVGARWFAALLIPPTLVLVVLGGLALLVSPRFSPNHFFMGAGFGVVAGFVEEIGWTGFAFPALQRRRSPFAAALVLGILWGLWHIPAVDYLGAATPHGRYWVPYLLAFVAVMSAIRIVICWIYTHTGSIVMAQMFHACSTGALVVFSPMVSPGQETVWYLLYAALLWGFVALLVAVQGKNLGRSAK